MNITFILGNGFDLNLNLCTDYKSFYEYYRSKPTTGEYANSIAKLKLEITTSLQGIGSVAEKSDCGIDWSDLEYALGQYARNISDENEFEAVYYDLRDNLKEYLTLQEKRLDELDEIDDSGFLTDLIEPEKYLSPVDIRKFRELKSVRGDKSYNIRVLTFNYTNTFEKLIEDKSNFKLQDNIDITISEVRHIHRLIDQLILGVNDVSQINNSNFRNNRFVVEMMVKPNHCSAYGDNHANECEKYISTADLIVLYGLSIGLTDKRWWQSVARQMRLYSSTLVIIFWYEKEYRDYSGYAPQQKREERKVRDDFMTKMGLSSSERESFASRIFVHLVRKRQRIFNLPKLQNTYDVRIAK